MAAQFPRCLLLILLLVTMVACGTQLASQPQSPQKPAADPQAAIRANNLGAAYMNQQKMEQALKEFDKAYAADPKLTTARLNQGIALLNLQRFAPARLVLREIVERDAKNVRAWYNLGLLEKNAGNAETALAAFQKAAALDPDDADTHYFIGTLLAQLERYPKAIAAFERAIALDRFHVSAEFGLARALQRSGDAEKARGHLARFQHLTTEKLGAPMSLAYGEQGRYSLAETVTLPPAGAPPPTPVKFMPVPASESGLKGHTDGACVADFDNDGWPDVFLPSGTFLRNVKGRFESVALENVELGTRPSRCVTGDYDNDGKPDIVIVGIPTTTELLRNAGAGTFRNVTRPAGISGDKYGWQAVFWDFDHDGDLDLYVLRELKESYRGNALWRNNGDGTFANWTDPTGLKGTGPAWVAAAADFNADRAIDIVLAEGKPGLYLNLREGPFKKLPVWEEPQPESAASMAALDFDRDGWLDLIFTHYASPDVTLWRNVGGERFARVPILNPRPIYPNQIVPFDYDNDGWMDLLFVGSGDDNKGRVKVFRNEGAKGFRDVTASLGISSFAMQIGAEALVFDADNDGDADIVLTGSEPGAMPALLRNEGGNKNSWLKLSLKGLADNKSAIGTKVEVFAGATYQKFEVTTPNDLLIGLGQEKQADVVRLLWPTGVVQDEVNLTANRRHVITEIDRRGSSCPILFAWNGSRYEFIADAAGPGIVGHWVAPGVRNTSDPTEYIKVPGSLLRERIGANGERRLSFRFAEPMEEIVYLDQLRLFAVDHPSNTVVNPSERFYASGPPFPTGEPVFTHREHVRPPAQAWDHRGNDVTALLRDKDRRYVTEFADAPYKGFAELHWIELDLGEAVARVSRRGDFVKTERENPASKEAGYTGGPLRLLLHGYTDYFTATSVYAAHQGGVTAIVPYVEALTSQGAWVRVEDDMGFPAGLARTMVADLTGKLPAGTRRIRIATNLKVYWDQVLIDTTPAGTPHRISEAPLAGATAGYLGYPREIRGTPESDIRYDYHSVSATGPYARAAGYYTRYGDVRALVATADDRFVIMGSGDEVAVEFDAVALPPLPEGWTRDWFFYVDGFAKDMDFYAAHPFTVTPLPYHAMPGYPYPEEHGYPATGVRLEDQLELNTRPVSGRPAPSYRFLFDPAPASPTSDPRGPSR